VLLLLPNCKPRYMVLCTVVVLGSLLNLLNSVALGGPGWYGEGRERCGFQ
jgi:hypothetical protein